MSVVRAKFFVKSINHLYPNSAKEVCAEIKLAPVYGSFGDGKDNESWSKYTPSGEISMMITNPGAIEKFDLGKSYYVDFTPAAS